MGNKSRSVSCENLIKSLQSSNVHSVLGNSDHDMFPAIQGIGDMTAAAHLLPLDSSQDADSHLMELITQHSTQGLMTGTQTDSLLGKSGNQDLDRHFDGLKNSWNSPSKVSQSTFSMLQDRLSAPGLKGSLNTYPLKANVLSSISAPERSFQPRQPEWRPNNLKPAILTGVKVDKSAIQKLPILIKPDLSSVRESLLPADSNSPLGHGPSKDLAGRDVKQMDSSDGSDHNMDEKEEKNAGSGTTGVGRAVSKNLVSERKRRKKLNEGLYTLRALVPRISKMDKASIIGDAIDYVRELQKQVEDLQSAISDMESRNGAAVEEVLSSVTDIKPGQVCDAVSDGRCWEDEGSRNSEVVGNHDCMERLSVDSAEQRILELDVSLMEDQIYHLRIFCTKGPGVFVQLMQSLEALGLEVMNANLMSLQDNILNTFIAEIKDWELMNSDDVKRAIMDVASRFGLQ